jgi:hypothetical protein
MGRFPLPSLIHSGDSGAGAGAGAGWGVSGNRSQNSSKLLVELRSCKRIFTSSLLASRQWVLILQNRCYTDFRYITKTSM